MGIEIWVIIKKSLIFEVMLEYNMINVFVLTLLSICGNENIIKRKNLIIINLNKNFIR